MTAQHVPDLKIKYQLAIQYGRLGSMNELAKILGRSAATLHGYAGSDPRRSPDFIPGEVFERFLALYCGLLPDRSSEECYRLLVGSSQPLRLALSRRSSGSLLELLEERCISGKIGLIHQTHLPLVEIMGDQDHPDEAVRMGEQFRLVFEGIHTSPYTLMLQHSGSLWGCSFPWFEEASGIHHVPGPPKGTDKPGYMRERKEEGLHSFYAILSSDPFPPALVTYARDSLPMDRAGLDQLHDFCERLSNRPHRIYRLRVLFEKP